MPLIAIIGAGPLAGALAHKLALRNRVAEVRLIDTAESIASGKALDILQSGPVDGFSTRLSAAASLHAAAGADVVAIADTAAGEEHSGEAALGLVKRLHAAGISAPLLFAGAQQRDLLRRSAYELRVPSELLLGSAPMALASSLRALSAVALDTSAVEICLNVFGVPPRHAVVTWHEATVSGQPLTSVMGAHQIAAVAARLPGLWPPGPYALASAGARVAEALCNGSRRQYSCFVDLGRGRVGAVPVELERGGVKRIVEPALTTLEQTSLDTALQQ